MKLIAAYDSKGNILGAIIDDGEYDRPRPVPTEGMRLGTFELPESTRSLALEEICTTFRVDAQSETLVKK